MVRLSQRDPRWATALIGDSGLRVGRWGCTITSICMGHSKLYRNYVTPDIACRTWQYTPGGLLIWGQTDFDGLEFIKRGYDYHWKDIKDYTDQPDRFAIVEVDKSHWCTVAFYIPFWGFVLHDPWDGKVLWRWKKRYRHITGYALFQQKP